MNCGLNTGLSKELDTSMVKIESMPHLLNQARRQLSRLRPSHQRSQLQSFTRREFDQAVAAMFKSKVQIQKDQTLALRHILSTAVTRVPYYKDIKIDLDNFSFNELHKFPIITKKMMVNDPESFMVSDLNLKLAQWSHTSGSSGSPFQFLVPNNSYARENIAMCRAWNMGGHYQPGDPVIMLRSYSPGPAEPIFRYAPADNFWYLSAFDINQDTLPKYLEIIQQSGAKVLRGYASSIYLFSLLLSKQGIKIPQIKTIITSSETLLPIYRQVIEAQFKVKVLDWYGLNERVVTVQQCTAGNYHNNDDYGIIEIDEHDHIIGTSLHNNFMPFIRYDTGDIAVVNQLPDSCPCGRTFTIPFSEIQGRSDDLLYKFDGTAVPTVNIYTAMHDIKNILQFKIIQEADLRITVQVVSHHPLSPIEKRQIIDVLKQRLGSIEIDIESVKLIPRNHKTGKIQACESHVKTKTRRANNAVASLAPYRLSSHRVWEQDSSRVYKLDWNEAAIMPSPRVLSVLRNLPDYYQLNWYPDTHNHELITRLAKYAGVAEQQVQYFAGSDAAHEYIVRAFLNPNELVTILAPTYDNFRVVALAQGAHIHYHQVPLDGPFQIEHLIEDLHAHHSALVYFANPNNPTGRIYQFSDIEKLTQSFPTTIFVIDEAYVEFAGVSAAPLINDHANIIITRTLSKAFALASLRFGYIITQEENIELLNRIRNAKLISTPAQFAAIAALQDIPYMQQYVRVINLAKDEFAQALITAGYRVINGGGNFILVDLITTERKLDLLKHLANQSVFIRDCGYIPNLSTFVRITIAPPEIMRNIAQKLINWRPT